MSNALWLASVRAWPRTSRPILTSPSLVCVCCTEACVGRFYAVAAGSRRDDYLHVHLRKADASVVVAHGGNFKATCLLGKVCQ